MTPERVHKTPNKKHREKPEPEEVSIPHEEIDELLENLEHLDEDLQEALLNHLDYLEGLPREWDG